MHKTERIAQAIQTVHQIRKQVREALNVKHLDGDTPETEREINRVIEVYCANEIASSIGNSAV